MMSREEVVKLKKLMEVWGLSLFRLVPGVALAGTIFSAVPGHGCF